MTQRVDHISLQDSYLNSFALYHFFRFNQYMVLKMKKKSYLARHIFFLKFRIEIKKKQQTNKHAF